MALKVPATALWGVVVLLCVLGTEAQREGCCYGRSRVAHGETVLTIPSACVSFTCYDGDIRPTHFGGVGASGCCEFGGLLYPDGSHLSAHCGVLSCVAGNWTLIGRIQDCCAHCTLYNTGHVSTFDSSHYHWAGACNYTVTQTGTSLNPDVGVFTSSEPCLNSSCLHHTTFKNDPHTLVSLSHVQLDAIFTILVNGNSYTVPESGVHLVQIGTTTYPLLVWRTIHCFFLLGSSGIMLLICHNRLVVWAYPTHSSQLHGLCGRFNFNPLDDMTARDGIVYPVHTFPLAFPESWRTAEQSRVLCRQQCRDCTNPTRSDACKESTEKRKSYHVRCAQLLHPVLAVDKQLKHHVDACQLELCLLDQAGVNQQLQQRMMNDQLFVAQISKVILARTLGDFVPEQLFAPLDGMCAAGSSWQDDCNWCSCSDGVPALARCTRRACLEEFVPELGEEYCTNGSRWRPDDCNVCECIRYGIVCSVGNCSGVPTPITQTGTPTVTFPPLIVCNLPKDTGTCSEFILLWYYDFVTGRCTQFFYGGCGGNQNKFNSERECQLMCGVATIPEIPRKPPGCFLALEVGPCEALLPRYYYNPAKDQCEQFFYGGCQGNFNRFRTFDECRRTCGGLDPNATITPPVCHLRWDPGTCSDRQLKYYYHADTNQCFVAYYSGCGGNGNRFDTSVECMQTCGETITTACPSAPLACPLDCAITIVLDPVTSCEKCVCVNTSTVLPTLPTASTCPPDLLVCPTYCRTTFTTDPSTGCPKCACDYPSLPSLPELA